VAFDAGSIEAKLTLDPSSFDRTLADREAKVKAFQDEPHKVKLLADLDTSSLGKARKAFTDLDNAISKDAMNRLRSSPQGSVLGALNALFSPHPVTGAPSPQQSAQQGLLGKMLNVPGGGQGSAASGNSGSSATGGNGTTVGSLLSNAPGSTSSTDDVVQKLTGSTPGNVSTTDDIRQALIGAGAQDVTTTDDIRQLLTGTGAQNTDTTDTIRQLLTGQGAANATTTDTINQKLAGTGAANATTTDTINQKLAGTGAKDTTTTDTVKEQLDTTSVAKTQSEASASGSRAGVSWSSMFASHLQSLLPKSATDTAEKTAKSSGDTSGASFFSGFSSRLGSFFSGFVKGAKKAGSDGGSALDSGLLGGIGPGILGISAKFATEWVAGIGLALGALPALAGVIGTGMGVAMIGGLLAAAVAGNAKLKAQFTALGGDFKTVIAAAAAPVIPALSAVLGQVPGMIRQLQAPLTGIFSAIAPQVQGVFAGITPVITGLLGVMQAAAPAFGPFIGALESLVSNIFPGIATVVKATIPFITQFAGDLSSLGKDLGGFFASAAPAIGASMTILSGLLGLVGDLLPVVMKLADIFATSLAPVFTDFAGVIKTLLPPLTLVGTVIAQFAGAVIGDLAGAFGSIATLIGALAPSLGTLATTLGGVFTVLENTGVFAVFGDALENLAVPLANLVNALVTGLAPVLPVLTSAFSDLVTTAIDVLSVSLGAVLTALTPVVSFLAQAAAAVIGFLQSTGLLVPVMAGLAIAFGPVSKGLLLMAEGLGAFTASSFVAGISGIVEGIVAFAGAAEGASLAETAMVAASLALDAVSPLGWAVLATAAIAALVVGVLALSRGSQDLEQVLAAQDDATGYNIAGYQKLAGQLTETAGGYAKLAAAQQNVIHGAGDTGAAALAAQYAAQGQAVSALAQNMQTRLTTLSGSLGVSKTTIEDWASAAGISAKQFAGAGENVGLLTTQIVGFVDKNAEAVTSAASLGTNIAIFGNDVFSATAQLDAFNSIWNTLVGNLLTKQEAVTSSDSAFSNLTQTIKSSGSGSLAASQSFQQYIEQIGSSVTTMVKQGTSISSVNGYLQGQIGNLESLGPLNKAQQADLNGLIAVQAALANSTNGLNAEQKTMITQFETGLIPDLQKLHADTPLVNTDISNLTNAIIQTGAKSAATAGDRAQLIKDLEASGLNAQQATTYVDGLQTSIKNLSGKVVQVGVVGSGSGTITFAEQNIKNASTGLLEFHASGGPVKGPGGPTDDMVPIWGSNGEFMMQASAVSKYGLGFMSMVNAGKLAAGGPIDISSILSAPDWMGDAMASAAQSAEGTDANLMIADMRAKIAAAAAAAAAAAKASAAAFIGSGGASGGVIEAMMTSMAAARGWTGAQLTALLEVESREAGFNMTAQNPTSSAYGLAQFINGASEYAQWGGNSTTASGQITAMLNYIAATYGTPEAAWQSELTRGFYDNGGPLQPGYTLAYNGTGRPEQVTSPAQAQSSQRSLDAIAARLDKLISVASQAPAATGQHVGAAIGGAAANASFRSRFPR
jgi:hypothetical protein